MDYEDISIELNVLIDRLDSIRDIMLESTKEVIDIGNVNYELKNIILKLDGIIDSMEDSNEKSMLETAKDHVTYASLDIIDNVIIFDKIKRLVDAKDIIIDIKAKHDTDGHL
jgi:predicted MarR family transcription regulator